MRLDAYLSENGLAKSRSYAAELIKNSLVTVNGITVVKPSFDVTGEKVEVIHELYDFVGRGGVKLEAALREFSVDVSGMTAIDIGASTGGFTDCLIKRGAKKVYAVDSGHGQLASSLLNDERVVNLEGFNAKNISPGSIPDICDIAVCDVSFISQTQLISSIRSVLSENGCFITLVKPQFECGREALGKGGIVKNKKYYYEAVKKVSETAAECGLALTGLIASPVTGGDGNREFLAYYTIASDNTVTDERIKEVTLCKSV